MSKDDRGEIFAEIGESFGEALKKGGVKGAIAVESDSTLYDLTAVAPRRMKIKPVIMDSPEGLRILRHSTAHLLAQSVMELYPDAKLSSGPPTDEGFYYDIQMPPVNQEAMEKIYEKMREISSRNLKIERIELSKNELLAKFGGNPYKTDLINGAVPDGGSSTVYKQGEFIDFCRGPHVPATSYIRHFRLLSTASAHYRGVATNPELVRIYGTSFPTEDGLKQFLHNREEAARRDHRKIGQEMDLFVFNSERAPGFPFYTPNGTVIKNELTQYMKELNQKYGWQDVQTPHAFRDVIWKQSGHYAKYKDDMFLFTLSDGDSYGLKPMNCPGHITIFEREPKSYREMPVLYSEPGTVYRYEKSGEVGGLTRPRMFTVDDGHGFLRSDQIFQEIGRVIEMIRLTFRTVFGEIETTFELSAIDKQNPDNYLISYKCAECGAEMESRFSSGTTERACQKCGSRNLMADFTLWDEATEQLRGALSASGIPFREIPGEAAFYGPKIDVHIRDALGRSWQLSTIQVDFFMPSNFGLYFINSESKHERIIMLHRAIFGSYERLMAILIEHYSGKFPTWISPLQAYIVPVSEKFSGYAVNVANHLQKLGIRAKADLGTETMNKKIKMIRGMRPSYIIVVGEREENNETVSVRNREGIQKSFTLQEFAKIIKEEVSERLTNQAF